MKQLVCLFCKTKYFSFSIFLLFSNVFFIVTPIISSILLSGEEVWLFLFSHLRTAYIISTHLQFKCSYYIYFEIQDE